MKQHILLTYFIIFFGLMTVSCGSSKNKEKSSPNSPSVEAQGALNQNNPQAEAQAPAGQNNPQAGVQAPPPPLKGSSVKTAEKRFIDLSSRSNLGACVILKIDKRYLGELSSPYEASSKNIKYIDIHRKLCAEAIKRKQDDCREMIALRQQTCDYALARQAKICGLDSACRAEAQKLQRENCGFKGLFDSQFYAKILIEKPPPTSYSLRMGGISETGESLHGCY